VVLISFVDLLKSVIVSISKLNHIYILKKIVGICMENYNCTCKIFVGNLSYCIILFMGLMIKNMCFLLGGYRLKYKGGRVCILP
jgi:hypothetical protein